MKNKIRELTNRSNGWGNEYRALKLTQFIRGWVNYFGMADMKKLLKETDEWLRHKIRAIHWKQWKKVKTRYKNLKKLGLNHYQAIKFANTRKGYWRVANSVILNTTLTNQFFNDLGLKSLTRQYIKIH